MTTAVKIHKNGCTSGFRTPVEKAKCLLGASWMEDLEAHLLQGYVFSTPTAFLMARPVPRKALVYGPWRTWKHEECDAWFVWCAVGSVRDLLSLMPFELPWVGWHRLGRGWTESHWVATARLRRTFNGF